MLESRMIETNRCERLGWWNLQATQSVADTFHCCYRIWNCFAGLTFFPVIAQLVLLKFCPESPRYTLVFEGDEAKAEKDLIALRGKSDVRSEIEAIKREVTEREVIHSVVK